VPTTRRTDCCSSRSRTARGWAALLRALAAHCSSLGVSRMSAGVEDEGSLAFAVHFGFVEVDREVQQTLTVGVVGDEPDPSALPAGIEVIDASRRPELWAACFATFGRDLTLPGASADQLTTTTSLRSR
jgi:mycothiol synthase